MELKIGKCRRGRRPLHRVIQTYWPPDLVLVLDQQEQQKFTPNPRADYRKLTTGELMVEAIGLEHGMLTEPSVREVARIFRRYLG